VTESLESLADENLPPELRAYLPTAELNAQANLARVQEANTKAIKETLRLAKASYKSAAPNDQKLRRVRHLAGEFSGHFTPFTACAKGCSDCCYQNVLLSRREAKLMAQGIGVPISEPVVKTKPGEPVDRNSHTGSPCPFLDDGTCEVYQDRPLVCRTLVNMDSDARLCKLIPGCSVPVPYLNTNDFQMFYAGLIKRDEDLADLREWFPKGLK
jgi:Fe-S-cluster containining protein